MNLYTVSSLIVVFVTSLSLTFLVRFIAIKKNIIDTPNERSSHSIPTPRGGGLAIAITWYCLIFYLYFSKQMEFKLFAALLSGLLLSIVSLIDDIITVKPKIRLAAQLGSAILGLYFLGGLQQVDFGFTICTVYWISNVLVVLGILWMINLFNFLDGTDGYLGSEGIFIFGSLFIFVNDFTLLFFAAIILGFLFWNWPKAKIFCGDVGSTLIGYNVALFAIYYQNTGQISIFIPLILSGLFWFDATITLVRRIRQKEKLSEAHKKHAYQRLHQSGYSHQKVLMIGLVMNAFLLILAYLGYRFTKYVLIFLALHILIMFLYIKFADNRKKST